MHHSSCQSPARAAGERLTRISPRCRTRPVGLADCWNPPFATPDRVAMPFPTTHPTLARALAERGYAEPTPVQAAVLQADAADRDMLVSAQTGSGKTVAYGLAFAATILGDAEH